MACSPTHTDGAHTPGGALDGLVDDVEMAHTLGWVPWMVEPLLLMAMYWWSPCRWWWSLAWWWCPYKCWYDDGGHVVCTEMFGSWILAQALGVPCEALAHEWRSHSTAANNEEYRLPMNLSKTKGFGGMVWEILQQNTSETYDKGTTKTWLFVWIYVWDGLVTIPRRPYVLFLAIQDGFPRGLS